MLCVHVCLLTLLLPPQEPAPQSFDTLIADFVSADEQAIQRAAVQIMRHEAQVVPFLVEILRDREENYPVFLGLENTDEEYEFQFEGAGSVEDDGLHPLALKLSALDSQWNEGSLKPLQLRTIPLTQPDELRVDTPVRQRAALLLGLLHEFADPSIAALEESLDASAFLADQAAWSLSQFGERAREVLMPRMLERATRERAAWILSQWEAPRTELILPLLAHADDATQMDFVTSWLVSSPSSDLALVEAITAHLLASSTTARKHLRRLAFVIGGISIPHWMSSYRSSTEDRDKRELLELLFEQAKRPDLERELLLPMLELVPELQAQLGSDRFSERVLAARFLQLLPLSDLEQRATVEALIALDKKRGNSARWEWIYFSGGFGSASEDAVEHLLNVLEAAQRGGWKKGQRTLGAAKALALIEDLDSTALARIAKLQVDAPEPWISHDLQVASRVPLPEPPKKARPIVEKNQVHELEDSLVRLFGGGPVEQRQTAEALIAEADPMVIEALIVYLRDHGEVFESEVYGESFESGYEFEPEATNEEDANLDEEEAIPEAPWLWGPDVSNALREVARVPIAMRQEIESGQSGEALVAYILGEMGSDAIAAVPALIRGVGFTHPANQQCLYALGRIGWKAHPQWVQLVAEFENPWHAYELILEDPLPDLDAITQLLATGSSELGECAMAAAARRGIPPEELLPELEQAIFGNTGIWSQEAITWLSALPIDVLDDWLDQTPDDDPLLPSLFHLLRLKGPGLTHEDCEDLLRWHRERWLNSLSDPESSLSSSIVEALAALRLSDELRREAIMALRSVPQNDDWNAALHWNSILLLECDADQLATKRIEAIGDWLEAPTDPLAYWRGNFALSALEQSETVGAVHVDTLMHLMPKGPAFEGRLATLLLRFGEEGLELYLQHGSTLRGKRREYWLQRLELSELLSQPNYAAQRTKLLESTDLELRTLAISATLQQSLPFELDLATERALAPEPQDVRARLLLAERSGQRGELDGLRAIDALARNSSTASLHRQNAIFALGRLAKEGSRRAAASRRLLDLAKDLYVVELRWIALDQFASHVTHSLEMRSVVQSFLADEQRLIARKAHSILQSW